LSWKRRVLLPYTVRDVAVGSAWPLVAVKFLVSSSRAVVQTFYGSYRDSSTAYTYVPLAMSKSRIAIYKLLNGH